MILSKAADRPVPAQSRGIAAASFALGDAAAGAWLWHAFIRFTGRPGPLWPGMLATAAAVALVAFALGLHRFRPGSRLLLIVRSGALAAALAALGILAGSRGWLPLTAGEALWIGAAAACAAWLQRAICFGAWPFPPAQPWEALRWIAVGIAGTLVMLPFYHNGSLGAGDAHWYAIMLADFLAQLRAGVFPVWVGQSVDAFNGAVSPLRYAPGYQYFGGIMDLLTARALEPMAVMNASLAVVYLLGGYSCYACLRSVARGRPWVACALSVLWVCCPGVWAPALAGDQYMTAMAIPFAPLVLYGCWRVWDRDDGWARFWIGAGLAGAWLCHAPVAVWLTLLSAGLYLPAMLLRHSWRREVGLVAFMAATFLVLGSVPFVSLATLDDQLHFGASAGYAVEMIRTNFPANFRPIRIGSSSLATYQAGYSLLGALLVSLVLLARTRPRAAWAFSIASVVLVPFVVPVPWLNSAIWMHLPDWFVTIQNVWPMQRLFLVWSTVIVFVAAIMLGSGGGARNASQRAALATAFLCGVAWSGHEAWKFVSPIGRSSAAQTQSSFSPDNLQLTRYAYSSFEYAPAYFSHSYMEPWFENRLLDWHTLEPVVTNADAAAPLPPAGLGPADPRLIQSGLLTAKVIAGSSFYQLFPQLVLEPGKRYAVRFEFLEPARAGTLQLMHPSMFREYGMPDSGAGIARADESVASLAFGSGPSNSHVVPMIVSGAPPYSISGMFISNEPNKESYPFAKYWLYTYDRSRLPIDVQSWIPYRARIVPQQGPAYLETPRMWLKGWRAKVNGRAAPTLRSPENLVMVPLAAGESTVTLEYHAPAVLSAAFWVSTAGWLGLCLLGLYQVSLFSAGSALKLRRTPFPARPASGATGSGAWASCAALALLALAATWFVSSHRHGKPPADLAGAGPIRIDFTRPYRQVGLTQPLLSTGHPHAGTIVFITYLDRRRVRLGADVWGSLFKSEPIDMDYNQVESLVVSDSALFPLGDPKVKALSPRELAQLRGNLRLELNGKTVLVAPCDAYETLPSEILVGESRFGSVSDAKFLGEILKAERLPVSRAVALPLAWRASERVRFPVGRIGASEPLLSATAGADTLLWSVTYVDDHEISIGCRAGGNPARTVELGYDAAKTHELAFSLRDPGEGTREPVASLEFDGAKVLSLGHSFTGVPPELVSGLCADAPGMQDRFTGSELDLSIQPGPPQPQDLIWAPGTEHMIVRFPAGKNGRSEPLVVTGLAGKGDFIYVTYVDDRHIRLGYDHWAYGGVKSGPIEVDYRIPHELWIGLGSLYPPLGDEARWRGFPLADRQRLASSLSVVLDGKKVLSLPASPYPSNPADVTVARNAIGGSSCNADFSGSVEFTDRVGAPADSAPAR